MYPLLRRASIVTGAAAATLALGASASFAHECYIANQSTKAQSGTKSQVWYQASILDEFGGDWTRAQRLCVTTGAAEAGVPLTINIMGKTPPAHEGVLGSKNPHESKSGDGKGIDHYFSGGYIMGLMAVADECGVTIPLE